MHHKRGIVRRPIVGAVIAPVAAFAATLVIVAVAATPAVADGACANEGHRVEQSSTYLPDCRAYELVTPAAKDSSNPEAGTGKYQSLREEALEPYGEFGLPSVRGARAAANGDKLAWVSRAALLPGQNSSGESYLSMRGVDGWSSEDVIPPLSTTPHEATCMSELGMAGWSADLTDGVLSLPAGAPRGFGAEPVGECGHDEPRLVEGEPQFGRNLFLRDNADASYRLVNVTPATVTPPSTPEGVEQTYFFAGFLAGSEDLTHIVFEEELPLTEDAPGWPSSWHGNDNLYEWSGGVVHLVNVLPDGSAVPNAVVAGTTRNLGSINGGKFVPMNIANFRHAVSADGSRIFFEAQGNLYVRENAGEPQSTLGTKGECTEPAKACTIQLDLPQGGSGAGGGGEWLAANAEGTTVFFSDEASAGLTASTRSGSGANLYEYELPTEAGKTGTLIDITPGAQAGVLGMAGASEDGSYAYFVAEGALTGAQANSDGASARSGKPNLYLLHGSDVTFIATLDVSSDACDWALRRFCALEGRPNGGLTARVSANGQYIAFNSTRSLTGYDNTEASTGAADYEIFLYGASTNKLSCASCQPSGAAPTAGGAAIHWPSEPGAFNFGLAKTFYPQRNVSDAGQVFFETFESLVNADTNDQRDVYEYEGGKLYLISSGTSASGAFFLDATPSGSDVFFATAEALLRRDTDTAFDYYDARVDGGFAEPPLPAPTCDSEACKGAAGTEPVSGSPGSVSFIGTGNLAPHTHKSKHKASKLTRGQRLRRALKACDRRYSRSRRRRRLCTRRVRARLAVGAQRHRRRRAGNRHPRQHRRHGASR